MCLQGSRRPEEARRGPRDALRESGSSSTALPWSSEEAPMDRCGPWADRDRLDPSRHRVPAGFVHVGRPDVGIHRHGGPVRRDPSRGIGVPEARPLAISPQSLLRPLLATPVVGLQDAIRQLAGVGDLPAADLRPRRSPARPLAARSGSSACPEDRTHAPSHEAGPDRAEQCAGQYGPQRQLRRHSRYHMAAESGRRRPAMRVTTAAAMPASASA